MPGNLIAQDLQATNRKVVMGQHTTVAAVDAVTFPQFTTIEAAVVCLGSDAADALNNVNCTFSGNVLTIKTWKHDGTDPTPVAATAFSKLVNYFVAGV